VSKPLKICKSGAAVCHRSFGMKRISHQTPKKMGVLLVASYVVDWVLLALGAAVGYLLGNITPNKRPIDLEDRGIGFPFTTNETVSTAVLVIVSVLAPIAIVLLVSIVVVPGPTTTKEAPTSLRWKRRLWEVHAGWLGLALSVVAAWLVTNGIKNLMGKPRPDLVSRCQPDIANLTSYIVGSNPALSSWFSPLVSAGICRNPDAVTLDDGFRSFPSGHSSLSAAGLVYLTLFLASKLGLAVPFVSALGSNRHSDMLQSAAFPSRSHPHRDLETHPSAPGGSVLENGATGKGPVLATRRQAAAPPIYLLLLVSIPTFAAIFISSSRWYDFRHHGFDIIAGFFIGTVTAVFAFRFYHAPVGRGAGWAWGPRNNEKAFWAGLGSTSYAVGGRKDSLPV
jgi:membrane-associated phospholipid phosphatase